MILDLNYALAMDLPVGTVVADSEDYWLRQRRKYVKTTENTWAVFFGAVLKEDVALAMDERRNNLTPCPTGRFEIVSAL